MIMLCSLAYEVRTGLDFGNEVSSGFHIILQLTGLNTTDQMPAARYERILS
jgi:hypothetical protein